MTRPRAATKLADEVALQRSEQLLAVKRARWQRDDVYGDQFRRACFDLFAELWPAGVSVDPAAYITTIERDINKINIELLQDLTDALMERVRAWGVDHVVDSAAAELTASWFKMRIIELRSSNLTSSFASELKRDHADFFSQVLTNRPAPGTDLRGSFGLSRPRTSMVPASTNARKNT